MFINKVNYSFGNNYFENIYRSENYEPKSIYIYYVPEDDKIIIYGDEFKKTNDESIHMAENVFTDTSKPIYFLKIFVFKNDNDYK
jgi:hypothetical protein